MKMQYPQSILKRLKAHSLLIDFYGLSIVELLHTGTLVKQDRMLAVQSTAICPTNKKGPVEAF